MGANQKELAKTISDWRSRAESMMRLSPKAAGTREMRVNASLLLELIAEFENTQTKSSQDAPSYGTQARHAPRSHADLSIAASSASC